VRTLANSIMTAPFSTLWVTEGAAITTAEPLKSKM